MKNIFGLGIIALASSLCIGNSALPFKDTKAPIRMEAINEPWQAMFINDTYYATSKAALNQKPVTPHIGIKLLRDVTETDCNIWLTTAQVTIDLNGHTLTIGSQNSPVDWFVAYGAGNVTENLNLTIQSSVAGGKINAYCTNAALFINPTQANGNYTCTAKIQSGVQINNFSSGRTIYMHERTNLTVQDGASVIATTANQPAITANGGVINNYGTIQGANNGVLLEPVSSSTPQISLYGANARVTPRIYSKRIGGITLSNYSYSENNSSVYPVNVTFDESSVTLPDNFNVFSNIHWKYKDNFSNYITISAAGSNYHTLTWAQQTYNQTGYLRWIRNTYTIRYDINGGKSGNTSSQSANAEQMVTLRSNGFVPQDYHVFKEWNTKADGNGISLQPGTNYTVTGNITLYAIWESKVIETIEAIDTRTSLAYRYSRDSEGHFTFTNLYVRFGGIITKSLWNALEEESHIIGFGELYSTDEYLGANELKSYYATAESNPNIEFHSYEVTSDPESYPALFSDSEYKGVTDDYYVWNIRRSVLEENYTEIYASVAFIITQDDGVVFFEETRKSVKSLAQDLLGGPDYNEQSLSGSLNYLANL